MDCIEDDNCKVNLILAQVTTNLSNTATKDFDGQVYITLIGEDGSTAEAQLQPGWDGASIFQPGGSDVFYINGLDVGHLKQLIVRMDKGASGAAKKLSLEYVDVYNTSSGVKVRFLSGLACCSFSPLRLF
jgi:hypothetical protein